MYQLEKEQYLKVLPMLKDSEWLFPIARSVIGLQLGGRIMVDDPHNPETAVVISQINWMYMFGNVNNPAFNAEFRKYVSDLLCKENEYFVWCNLSVGWQIELKNMFGDKIKSFPRIPFKFNTAKYLQSKEGFSDLPEGFTIKRIDKVLIKQACELFPGIIMFWDNYDNFLENGIGFCALHNNEVVCVCQSAVNVAGVSEIDIFTSEKHRSKGLAAHTCSAFIDCCIGNGLTPDWDCVEVNQPSYNLAKKLGFEELQKYPLFFWHKDF